MIVLLIDTSSFARDSFYCFIEIDKESTKLITKTTTANNCHTNWGGAFLSFFFLVIVVLDDDTVVLL